MRKYLKKLMNKKLNNEKGLTLIELLAVIVIIAIIAAIAIPAIGNIIDNSRNGAAKADYQNVLSAANIYFTENPKGMTPTAATATVTVAELIAKDFIDDAGTIETGTVTRGTNGASNTIFGVNENTQHSIASPGLTNEKLSGIPNNQFNAAGITAALAN